MYSDTEKRLQLNYYDDLKIVFFKVIMYLVAKYENNQTVYNILEISYSHWAETRTLIGGGGVCVFMYSCFARRVSFQVKFKLDPSGRT